MARRIEIALKDGLSDPRGERIKREIKQFLQIGIQHVRTLDIYTVDADLTNAELETAAYGPFYDPVIQKSSVDLPLAVLPATAASTSECQDGKGECSKGVMFDWAVEIGLRPGVTDIAGRTAREAIESLTGRPFADGEGVYSGVQYLLTGQLTGEQVEQITTQLLCNSLIQRYSILSASDFMARRGFPAVVPKVVIATKGEVKEISLEVSDEELMRISRDGVLALTLEEMQVIQAHYRDPAVQSARAAHGLSGNPTDVELECLAQTWSEHCKHKIFSATVQYEDENGQKQEIRSLFKSFIQQTTKEVRQNLGADDFCLSVFKDNAGVITFDDKHSLVFKAETHNSPSALDPYGGAMTGILGVNRDTFGTGQGSSMIFNTSVSCFADPFYDKPLPTRLLHPRRIYKGVADGVEDGSNKSGVPTVNGSIVFDERFAGKPLVFCGTAGLMPSEINGIPGHEKSIKPGDLIVMTGGRIGIDGIHGATSSSEELNENSPATTVQLGDPILQKRMFDFLLAARDQGLYRFITDNGAGGLSSSVGEMSEESGGCRMDLAKAPLKYPGLHPWEILISEAQERMSIAVPPEKIDQLLELSRHFGVESTVLGEFTDSGFFHITYKDKTVAWLPLRFMHDGVPEMQIQARWQPPVNPEAPAQQKDDWTPDLVKLLGRLNICSKESVFRRFDHEVQGGSIIKPFAGADNDGPSDAAVVQPVPDSFKGVVVSHGICPAYSDIDTYHMSANAIDEALRNYIAVGGNPDHWAGLDNFCWCDPVLSEKTPDGPYKMAQLVRANQALLDYCVPLNLPLISGKDSMKNDFYDGTVKISIPPTLLFSLIGTIPDVRRAVSMDFKQAGDVIYLLGNTEDELGGSEYLAMQGYVGNNVPKVDVESALKRYKALHQAMMAGLVASAHDLAGGGLAVALAESAFAGGLGCQVELEKVCYEGAADSKRDELLLFSESASRLLITVKPENTAAFEAALAGTAFSKIGQVAETDSVIITGFNGKPVLNGNLAELKSVWQRTLEEL